MKSPWKFFARITARRRPAETPEPSVGDATDTEASETGVRQTSALSANSTKESSSPDHDVNHSGDLAAMMTSDKSDSNFDIPEAVLPARHEVSRSDAGAHALVLNGPKGKKSPRKTRATQPGRANRFVSVKVSESTVIAKSDPDAQSSFSRERFLEEVTNLDEENQASEMPIGAKAASAECSAHEAA